jgi:hypothetical protein
LNRLEVEIGDVVIPCLGERGVVTGTCDCSECVRRGFEEISFKTVSGSDQWITAYDWEVGFNRYYKIGKFIWPEHVDVDATLFWIKHYEDAKDEAVKTINAARELLSMIDTKHNET